MAREVFVKLWCDPHMADDPNARVEGETVPIKIGNVGGELDMCDEHRHSLVDPLVTLLHQLGKPVQQTALPPKGGTNGRGTTNSYHKWCYICESYIPTPSANGHYLERHHVAVADIIGSTCPLDGEAFKAFQGLTVHLTKGHDGLLHEDAFRQADREGDPHGVVQALRERVKAVAER